MILFFGTRTLVQDDDRAIGGVRSCPRCGQTVVFHPKRARSYIHIFWLPIIPLESWRAVVQCSKCGWYGEDGVGAI